jgi:hypothetical protein
MSLALNLLGHLVQVSRGGLLAITLQVLNTAYKLNVELEVNKNLNVSVPIVFRRHRLEQDLV